jgi:hypothetical protein
MMVVTHVLVGLLLAAAIAVTAPAYATPAAVGAVVGGLAPDLDLFYGTHRRTLHFPVAGSVLAGVAVAVAVVAPSPLSVGAAVAFLAAAIHAASDALGAGEELRPWERTNPNAVYDHVRGRWIGARYLVPYDGSPHDLLVTVVCAVPVATVYGGPVRWLVAALLVVAATYTLARKRVVTYFERFA